MAYEVRDNQISFEEMRAFQNMAAFDHDEYVRKLNAYEKGEPDPMTAYMPDLDGGERVCKCIKESIPSSTSHVTHYACSETMQGSCKHGAYQGFNGECAFLAKMTLPGTMGHVMKSCTHGDAHAEADVIAAINS